MMFDNPQWYKSPIVWIILIQALIAALLAFQEWYQKGDFSVPAIITFVISVLAIILRVILANFTKPDNPTPEPPKESK